MIKTSADNSKKGQFPSKTTISFNEMQHTALEEILNAATTTPVLSYTDYKQTFILHTDTSDEGLGCILYQPQQEKLGVMVYDNQTLTKAEKNYRIHSNKLEFLCLYWAVTNQFRHYGYCVKDITIYTNNNPLLYITSTNKLNCCGQRWINQLAKFNFHQSTSQVK